MVIWSGWGILVVPIALICAVAGSAIPGPEVLQTGVFAVLAATATWVFSHLLDRRPKRLLVDLATGERVVLRQNDSLFFIPVRFWPYLILMIGAAAILSQ